MIYITGDTHGTLDIEELNKFLYERDISKEDYLIILGDVGLYWTGDKRDEGVKHYLDNLGLTVLWLDGNHENFDLIDALPIEEWHGGKVQKTTDNIIHLMRGQVYEIEGKTFFVFGGGFSIDKAYRRNHISWWEREMPSKEEYEEGKRNLDVIENKVDYVLTHTAPNRICRQLVSNIIPGEEELQDYLQEIAMGTQFKKWYFGHWHMDRELGDYIAMYNKVVKIY